MKGKKILSLALSGVMALSLAVPAFAEETEITGSYTEPTIAVDVTPSAAAFINPLGLEVEVATGLKVSGQILSAPMTIKNKSAMDLQVDASMTTTVNEGSDLRFVGTSTGGTGATKTIFAYLQAKEDKTLVGADTAVDDAAIATAFGNWAASAYNSTTDLVANTAMAATKSELVVVRAADMSGANGAFAAYKPGSIALVRLAGDCVTNPTAGAWVETDTDDDGNVTGDGFTINVAYTFSQANLVKYDVTVNNTTTGTTNIVAAVDAQKAAVGDVVSVKVTSLGSAAKAKITVKDASGAAVTTDPADGVVEVLATNDTVTFTMPAKGVTIEIAPGT